MPTVLWQCCKYTSDRQQIARDPAFFHRFIEGTISRRLYYYGNQKNLAILLPKPLKLRIRVLVGKKIAVRPLPDKLYSCYFAQVRSSSNSKMTF